MFKTDITVKLSKLLHHQDNLIQLHFKILLFVLFHLSVTIVLGNALCKRFKHNFVVSF